MTALDEFWEPIEIAGSPLANHWAYRMDDGPGKPDMREHAGLGPCNCCDYFVTDSDSIILIEETKLLESIEGWQREVPYLNETDQKKFVGEKVKTENRLKVYGALLVLSRLTNKYDDIRNLIGEKKYSFWIVVSGLSTDDDKRYFDNVKDHLTKELRGTLSPAVIDKVKVFPSNLLEGELPVNKSTL